MFERLNTTANSTGATVCILARDTFWHLKKGIHSLSTSRSRLAEPPAHRVSFWFALGALFVFVANPVWKPPIMRTIQGGTPEEEIKEETANGLSSTTTLSPSLTKTKEDNEVADPVANLVMQDLPEPSAVPETHRAVKEEPKVKEESLKTAENTTDSAIPAPTPVNLAESTNTPNESNSEAEPVPVAATATDTGGVDDAVADIDNFFDTKDAETAAAAAAAADALPDTKEEDAKEAQLAVATGTTHTDPTSALVAHPPIPAAHEIVNTPAHAAAVAAAFATTPVDSGEPRKKRKYTKRKRRRVAPVETPPPPRRSLLEETDLLKKYILKCKDIAQDSPAISAALEALEGIRIRVEEEKKRLQEAVRIKKENDIERAKIRAAAQEAEEKRLREQGISAEEAAQDGDGTAPQKKKRGPYVKRNRGGSAKDIEKWNLRFEELKAYKAEHGDCLVPSVYPKNNQLACWVRQQRTHYRLLAEGKPSCINPERIGSLQMLGFTWTTRGTPAEMWAAKLEELKAYKAEHGHCVVPQKSKTHPKLGKWVDTQRVQYKLLKEGKKSHMTPERITILDSLGFAWVAQSPKNRQKAAAAKAAAQAAAAGGVPAPGTPGAAPSTARPKKRGRKTKTPTMPQAQQQQPQQPPLPGHSGMHQPLVPTPQVQHHHHQPPAHQLPPQPQQPPHPHTPHQVQYHQHYQPQTHPASVDPYAASHQQPPPGTAPPPGVDPYAAQRQPQPHSTPGAAPPPGTIDPYAAQRQAQQHPPPGSALPPPPPERQQYQVAPAPPPPPGYEHYEYNPASVAPQPLSASAPPPPGHPSQPTQAPPQPGHPQAHPPPGHPQAPAPGQAGAPPSGQPGAPPPPGHPQPGQPATTPGQQQQPPPPSPQTQPDHTAWAQWPPHAQ